MADPSKEEKLKAELDLDREMSMVLNTRKVPPSRSKRREYTVAAGSLESTLSPTAALPPSQKMLSFLMKVMFSPIIILMGHTKKNYKFGGDVVVTRRPWWWLMLDGILVRLLLAPVILTVFLMVVVHSNTHPARVTASITPSSLGLYYKRMKLVTVDEQVLSAWYVPPLSLVEMALDPASASRKWPAVVLCHGIGATQEQYLPLAERLHRMGFAVLLVDMRGQGESEAAGVTYGLREQLDVLAGVQYLRELPNIDGSKVCVVGRDIGAIAVLQAASQDSTIAAVVADGLWPRFEERARNIFSRPGGRALPTGWLAPLYTAAFGVTSKDHVQRLDPALTVRRLRSRPVFFVARLGSQYMSLREVMDLATDADSQHNMMVAGTGTGYGGVEDRVSEFLMRATGWQGMPVKENRKTAEDNE